MSKFALPPDDIIFVRNLLRKGSTQWPGRAACLKAARKKVLIGYTKKGRPIYKFHWQCAKCKKWHRNQDAMEVDHIVEIGSFNGDWNEYLFRHFPNPATGLQAMCAVCHLKKTKAYNSARTKWTRKK